MNAKRCQATTLQKSRHDAGATVPDGGLKARPYISRFHLPSSARRAMLSLASRRAWRARSPSVRRVDCRPGKAHP